MACPGMCPAAALVPFQSRPAQPHPISLHCRIPWRLLPPTTTLAADRAAVCSWYDQLFLFSWSSFFGSNS